MIYEKKLKINNMISKLKDKNILKEIFTLVQSELNINGECRYTCNNNGIFFDLNLLSDKVLLNIENILLSNIIETESEPIFTSYEETDDSISKKNYIKDT